MTKMLVGNDVNGRSAIHASAEAFAKEDSARGGLDKSSPYLIICIIFLYTSAKSTDLQL
jgi:hypothetical protein